MSTLSRTFSVKTGIDVANTVVIDSNRNLSNVANLDANNITANTVNVSGDITSQNIIPVANTTYNLGSPTRRFKDLYLSGSTLDLNGTTIKVVGDEIQSNTFNAAISFVSGGINVLDQANTARTTANDAYGQANAAYGTANTANTIGKNAYAQANTATTNAGNAYDKANTADTDALNAYAKANSAANTVRVSSNSGSTLSSKQLNFVNTSTAIVTVADSGNGNANITVDVIGGGAIAQAYDQANAAYNAANTANTNALNAYADANTANTIAKNAYAAANGKLSLTGGTISGDLTVSGNLFLSQNTTLINVSTYQVEDPLIYLASNNHVSDAVDIGFMGGKNTSGTYAHTGLVRHAADQKYYLFDGLPDEAHTNNVVNVAATYMATLRANIEANSITLGGATVATQANLTIAHDQANAAYGQANAAYTTANTANTIGKNAYGQANTAQITSQNAYAAANTANTNALNAYDAANTAYIHATDAYDRANTKVSKSGDTMTGGLTITTSGTGLSVGNASVTFLLKVGSLNVTTNTVTTASSGQVVLDKFPATDLASVKYFIQVSSGVNYHTTEMVLVQDATNVWISEYGSIQTGPSLGTFSADISSGDVRLLFTAVNATNTIRSVRYGIAT